MVLVSLGSEQLAAVQKRAGVAVVGTLRSGEARSAVKDSKPRLALRSSAPKRSLGMANQAAHMTLAAAITCIGIGIQRGTHTRWQLVVNDGTGAPILTDMGASFAIATGGVLTLNRGTAQWQFGLGASGGRGLGRGVRERDHRRSTFQHPVSLAEAVHEQQRHGSGGRVRLLGDLSGDRLLT